MQSHRCCRIVFSIALGIVALGRYRTQAQCELTELQKLLAADGAAGDAFGSSIALDGDRTVIGAFAADCPGGTSCGAAYVFFWDGTVWAQEAKLVASDASNDSRFATSVAINGERIVVGAPRDDQAANDAGAAYVFRRQGGAWTQEVKLTASDAASEDNFGQGVAILDQGLIVGSPRDDYSGHDDAGSASVYRYDGANWVERPKLFPDLTGIEPNSFGPFLFGYSVAMDGERALISAITDARCFGNTAISCGGAVDVFRRSGSDWMREDHMGGDLVQGIPFALGQSIDLSGELAIASDHDGAWVYRRLGSDWPIDAKLAPPGLTETALLSYPVSVINDLVCVGSPYNDPHGVTNAGSGHVYRYDGNAWVEVAQLGASDAAAEDRFGSWVDASEEHLLLGSAGHDEPGAADVGAVYAFGLPADCNNNFVEDRCDTANQTSLDCNSDSVPDECQLGYNDCNTNGVPDECDVASATSPDVDGNGYPDECCVPVASPSAEPGAVAKNRYLSLVPGNAGRLTALRVTLASLNHPDPPGTSGSLSFSAFEGQVRWVGPPQEFTESASNPATFLASALQCAPHVMDWGALGVVHAYGAPVLPSSLYDVQAVAAACLPGSEANFSTPALSIPTARWGDVTPPYQQTCAESGCSPCTSACRTQPEGVDIAQLVNKFKSLPGAAEKVRAQLQPNVPNPAVEVDALDIAVTVNAFKDFAYPYPGPAPCPP